MPSVSKQQQKFMGLVHAIQKGDVPKSAVSKQAQQVAKDMDPKDVKDFASTKHKGLPKRVKQEILKKLKEYAFVANKHSMPAAKLEPLRKDYEMDLQNEDRIPQNFNVGTTSDYHKNVGSKKKKYDDTNFEKDNSGQPDLKEVGKLVYKINKPAVEKFIKKYPRVKEVMNAIISKNSDTMKGYKAFIKFKDKNESYLGGKGEESVSKNFGSKIFYKYDWNGVGGWAEVYEYLYDKQNESVNEVKTYKKGDKLKIKLPNGKKFDVVFDAYSRTKGVAMGKFKDGHGEYDVKPFNLNTVVESVNEASKSDIIKDLDKAKNDLLKKVDILIAKKKKLYSNVDIESPMTADEKKLDKDIADLFSDINKLVLQKRSLKEAQAVSGGKVHKLITGKNLKFKGKSYNQIDFETIGVDNKNGTIRLKIIAPKEIFGNEMSLDFRTVRRGPFFKTDTSNQLSEVGLGDWHYKAIKKMYQRAGAFTRKKIAAVITSNPNANWNEIEKEIKFSDYEEITNYTDKLGLSEVLKKLENLKQ